jgi:hypothetical protein
VKLVQEMAVHRAVQDALPYGAPVSVAVALEDSSQLPHCVVVRLGTRLLRDAYGGANVVVVVGLGREVAVRIVSVCVKLKSRNVYTGVAVA